MANAHKVKMDVINELRNRLYYNQTEIQRLVTDPVGISHKEVVDTVILYLKLNVEAQSSIELMEAYLPAQQPQKPVQVAEQPAQNETDVAVKKID